MKLAALADAFKRMQVAEASKVCAICQQPLSQAERDLRISSHFECVWLDALTSPDRPSK